MIGTNERPFMVVVISVV